MNKYFRLVYFLGMCQAESDNQGAPKTKCENKKYRRILFFYRNLPSRIRCIYIYIKNIYLYKYIIYIIYTIRVPPQKNPPLNPQRKKHHSKKREATRPTKPVPALRSKTRAPGEPRVPGGWKFQTSMEFPGSQTTYIYCQLGDCIYHLPPIKGTRNSYWKPPKKNARKNGGRLGGWIIPRYWGSSWDIWDGIPPFFLKGKYYYKSLKLYCSGTRRAQSKQL